jgi:hypothetical protein
MQNLCSGRIGGTDSSITVVGDEYEMTNNGGIAHSYEESPHDHNTGTYTH